MLNKIPWRRARRFIANFLALITRKFYVRTVFLFLARGLWALIERLSEWATTWARRFLQLFVRSVSSTRYMMHAFVIIVTLTFSLSGLMARGAIGSTSAGLNQYVVAFGSDVSAVAYASVVETGYLSKNALAQTNSVLRQPEGVFVYDVRGGDSLSSIASQFNISIKTIQWANQLVNVNQLKPGQKLTILPVNGVLYQVKENESLADVAGNYSLSENDLIAANDLVEPVRLKTDQQLVIPLANDKIPDMPKPEPPKVAAKSSSSSSGNLSVDRANVGSTVGGGNFGWPTTGTITKNFFQHSRSDGAIDIANRSRPPVYASDSGVVVVSGWDKSGYGNRVDIDHGNGFVTRYGHLDEIYVSSGQSVSKGQVIGKMGCTGRCTGPHVHFMIIQNGTPRNPLDYL